MAATIDATAKGASANSYVTLAEADTYFDERLNVTDWSDATTDEQNRALIMATKRLEQEDYRGRRTTQGQALQWPRVAMFDRDGFSYDQDVIPTPVKRATFELALELLKSDLLADTGLSAFESVSIGGAVDIEVRHTKAGQLPDNVFRELEIFLRASAGGPRLARA